MQSFGRYRVTGPLGAGAMGEVYAAVDEVLGREVAIKALKPVAGALLLDDRFRQEARAIAKLSHPGVVAVFDLDLAADPPYLVMERVAGPSLAERLDDGPLADDELVALGIQIARALAAAHAAGIVHRDVKPANILGAGPGTWKLADFGVAHVPDSSLTITGQFVGSPAYAPPEALVQGVSSPAGDVYGLGATLYEAAAGSWPRVEAKGAPLAPVPPLRARAPHVPAHVADAIDRAVALDRHARPSVAKLAELLAGVATERAAPRWKPWAIAAAIALVVVAIGLGTRGSPAELTRPDDARERDWQRIGDDMARGYVDGARRKLDDWEGRWGETPDSRALRDELDEQRPRGKGKHKRDDD